MKNKHLLSLALVTGMFCASCSNDDSFFEFDEDEMMEIAVSPEFQSYVTTRYYVMNRILNEADSCKQNGDSVYIVPHYLMDEYTTSLNQLLMEYPQFQKYSFEDKKEITCLALSIEPELSKTLGNERKYYVRTRGGKGPEKMAHVMMYRWDGGTRYEKYAYDNYLDALLEARVYGRSYEEYNNGKKVYSSPKETGGFVFADGSALETRDLESHSRDTMINGKKHWITSMELGDIYNKFQKNNNVNEYDSLCLIYHYHPWLDSEETKGVDDEYAKTLKKYCPNLSYSIIVTDKEYRFHPI